MNELALFAGAGGGILGGTLLGWRTVAAVEIEDYPRRVLLQRQADGILPRFPIWDDVTTFDGKPWRGHVDVISGGFPCQDISVAGLGAGITGLRSGLWKEFARIIGEVRPRYVFIENSPNLKNKGLEVVLEDLWKLGYDATWGVIGAHNSGAPHKRDRIWILAHAIWSDESREESRDWLSERMGWKRESIPWNESCQRALSRFRGMDDGLARVVDRTDAIRNGQVPAVATIAWDTLMVISAGIETRVKV